MVDGDVTHCIVCVVMCVVCVQGSNPITQERLEEAVRVIISYQNFDGGMATYENTRSFHWLEVRRLDPAVL
jgi:hypothetical protein